jgi:mRNA-degrading endonuclease toxin of MazEF toxin-antitoxin module
MSEQESDVYFYDREIWWCALGANIGFEQDGKNDTFERPVLILRKFNKHMAWVLPLTSRDKKESPFYQATEHEGKTYYIILSQVRTISSKRLLRKLRTLPEEEFEQVREKVKGFL